MITYTHAIMTEIGFIILRHVTNESTNKYWIQCYNCIRNFYLENKIMIVDDNSDYKFITDIDLYKTTVINSAYPGRGELLPYYYFLTNKLFDTAVILHDSVFINARIDMNVTEYKIIWNFEHYWDQIEDETRLIKLFNDPELLKFYENKMLWTGCFGYMSIITHDYLKTVNDTYDISKLLEHVHNRIHRCSLERVIACLLQKHTGKTESLLGIINNYCAWGIPFGDRDKYTHLPLIKIWTGR